MKKRFFNRKTAVLSLIGISAAFALTFFIVDSPMIQLSKSDAVLKADAATAGCIQDHDLTPGWNPFTGSVSIVNHSSNCTYNVGVAVYKMFDAKEPQSEETQELYDHKEAVSAPNSEVRLMVSLPSCAYQIDMFQGQLLTSFAGGVRYNDRIIGGYGQMVLTGGLCTHNPPPPPPTMPGCPFNAQADRYIVNFNGDKIVSANNVGLNPETSANANIPAGKYNVSLASWDGYVGRENDSQPHEQWFAKLMNGSTVVAQSNSIRDLADNVLTASAQEQVNAGLVFNQSINQVIARSTNYLDNSSPNSVFPICAAFDKITEVPQNGCIDVVKETYNTTGSPITPVAQFTFKLDGNTTVQNDSSGHAQFTDVSPGSHTVSENTADGWTLYNVTPANGQVNVASGSQCVTVVFKNQQNQIVNNDFTVSCDASDSSLEIGDNVTYTADVNGGNGNFTYSWTGTDNLLSDSQSVTKSYGSSGTKTASVQVTSDGHTHTAQCSVIVHEENNNDLNVSCDANPSSVDTDERVTFTADASGGDGDYTYDWDGDDDVSGNSSVIHHSYDDSGSYDAEVTVHDGSGNEDTAQCHVHVRDNEDEDLTGSCDASPSRVAVGETVTWRADADGGDGDFDYDWSGDDDLDGSSRTVRMSYDTAGTKEAEVRIRSNGDTITKRCDVDVYDNTTYVPPTYPTTPPPSYVTLNQVPYTGAGSTVKVALFVLSLMAWSTFIALMVVRKKAKKNGLTLGQQLSTDVSGNIRTMKAKLAKENKYDFLRK